MVLSYCSNLQVFLFHYLFSFLPCSVAKKTDCFVLVAVDRTVHGIWDLVLLHLSSIFLSSFLTPFLEVHKFFSNVYGIGVAGVI